jgi:hypothetical protein
MRIRAAHHNTAAGLCQYCCHYSLKVQATLHYKRGFLNTLVE